MDGKCMPLRVSESQRISLIYVLTLRLHATEGKVECAAFAAGSCTLDMWGGTDKAQYLRPSRVVSRKVFRFVQLMGSESSSKIKGIRRADVG